MITRRAAARAVAGPDAMAYDPAATHRPLLAMPKRACILLGLALLTAGCGKVREEGKNNALEAATNGYGDALRWGYYETAIGYLNPDAPLEVPPGLDNIRVTSYDVVQPPLRQGEESAIQVVRIEYLHTDVQKVKNLVDRQTWRYDPAAKTWRLHSGLPAFR